jgi:hypothetical protein
MPNKAVAAGATTALAGAVTTLVLSLLGHPVSAEVAGALTTVVSAVLAFIATWLTRFEGS